MKKTTRRLITVIMAAILLFAIAVPVSAEEFEFEDNPNCIWSMSITEGKEYTGFCDRIEQGHKIYSNNEEIMYVEEDGTLVAKSEGHAIIAQVYEGELLYYYGFSVRPQQNIVSDTFNEMVDEQREKFEDRIKEQEDSIDFMDIFGPILIVIVVLLVLAEIAYIFVTAPKYGMTRLWAIAPLIGNVFGLFVFLVLKTMAKQDSNHSVNVITCPTCNGRHPYGTSVCSICGTKLDK